MSADGDAIEDFRRDIRERIEPGTAELVVRWADGHQQSFDVVDTRRVGGWLIAKTPTGEQIEVSPALETILVGELSESEFQP